MGWVVFWCPLGNYRGITVLAGVIVPDFPGEIGLFLYNGDKKEYVSFLPL